MRDEVPDREEGSAVERVMLVDHSLLMFPAAFEVLEQLILTERCWIHGLQGEVRLDRGRLHLLVPSL